MFHNRMPAAATRLVLLALVLMLLVACGGSEPETAVPTPEDVAVVQDDGAGADVESVEPTAVADEPAPEPEPTAVPEPTATDEPAPEPTAEPEPTQETAVGGDVREELFALLDAQREVGSWRAMQVIETDEGTFESTVDHVVPDRFRMTMDFAGQTMELIIIGDTFYQNMGGTWTELPVDLGQQFTNIYSNPDAFLEEAVTDVEFVGTEDLDGVPTRVYRFTSVDTIEGTDATTDVTMWVRESDNLPIKQLILTNADGVTGTITQTYDYDVEIVIEPPQ